MLDVRLLHCCPCADLDIAMTVVVMFVTFYKNRTRDKLMEVIAVCWIVLRSPCQSPYKSGQLYFFGSVNERR